MLKMQPIKQAQTLQTGAGPIAEHLDFLAASLRTQGYAAGTIRCHVRCARAFGHWLAENQYTITDANEITVSRYIAELRRTKEQSDFTRKSVSALPHLLSMLERQAVCTMPPALDSPAIPTEATQWLEIFDNHLFQALGLAPASRKRYCYFIGRFLAAYSGEAIPDWSLLQAEHLTSFVHQEISRLNGHARKAPITAIRALLRYLVGKGEVRAGLEAALPLMPQWKHAALPKFLSADEVERVVTSALDNQRHGIRDHAILLLLARMGLRASEIVQLTLDDLDWNEGILLIRAGKSRQERRLPLLREIGVALCSYLQHGRPQSPLRTVFLNVQAPFGPFRDSSTIAKIVRRAMIGAGIAVPSAAAHALRHTAATRMVRSGVSFKDVADILGHASLETTAIYAKLDIETLSRVALPWPGGVQ